jgi:hypothetical protein
MKRSHTAIGIAILLLSALYFIGLVGISGDEGYAGLSPRFMPTLVARHPGRHGVDRLAGLRAGVDAADGMRGARLWQPPFPARRADRPGHHAPCGRSSPCWLPLLNINGFYDGYPEPVDAWLRR